MLASLLLVSLAAAEEGGISDAETSFTGAIILEGKVDASFGEYGEGWSSMGNQTEYAYWSGNTLYVGAEDEYGNTIDGIVEFFWFESSIDRGSDFYVASIKSRTNPNLDESRLAVSSALPVQEVWAEADFGSGQAFRWDWSLPFENYGLESFGQATLRNSYGIGGSAEGSAMAAKKVTDKTTGATAEVSVQAKGNVSSEYNVKTEYTTELWSWYTDVDGRPGEMIWSTTLDNMSKDKESAYYEYFLVMQADEGQSFMVDSLNFHGGTESSIMGWDQSFAVVIHDIELSRPAYTPDEPVDTGDTGEDTGTEDTGPFDSDTGETDETDPSAGGPGGGPSNPFADPGEESGGFFGCSSTAGGSFAGFGLLLAGLALVFRRRD